MGRFWPWKRRERVYLIAEGEQARQQAEECLLAAQGQRPDVLHVSESLRDLRNENHFAARIENLIRGGHQE